MATTVHSTTGTAPIEVVPHPDGTVHLYLEDGSGQVYRVADLLAAPTGQSCARELR
ncbi:hypothetical protein ACFSBG_06150 [Georgenia yuyongxinii]|uniref:hypothetical protein n=1 Tax=Georgenia yuyongxinii TaxID=2589797 RepID=UPI00143CDF34|nr:hypothetical protein [Georgenia yuyongxinii]